MLTARTVEASVIMPLICVFDQGDKALLGSAHALNDSNQHKLMHI